VYISQCANLFFPFVPTSKEQAMSEQVTTEPTATDSGRETGGSFAKGNKFGRGNPFGRKAAAFRTALMETVSEQDMKDIAAKLRDDAKAGDKTAVKILFQYLIGKPQPAVDPDTLDAQEMRTFAANSLLPEALEQMQSMVPLGWLASVWSIYADCMNKTVAKEMGAQMVATDAKEERRAAKARAKAERKARREEALRAQPAAPSPNPAMWVENFSAQDGVSPGSPRGDFFREQREGIDAGHGVGLGRWATSPFRQRGI
jgi:hypothetical protein